MGTRSRYKFVTSPHQTLSRKTRLAVDPAAITTALSSVEAAARPAATPRPAGCSLPTAHWPPWPPTRREASAPRPPQTTSRRGAASPATPPPPTLPPLPPSPPHRREIPACRGHQHHVPQGGRRAGCPLPPPPPAHPLARPPARPRLVAADGVVAENARPRRARGTQLTPLQPPTRPRDGATSARTHRRRRPWRGRPLASAPPTLAARGVGGRPPARLPPPTRQ